jgi:lipopolysaccharide/colanic/teichoic acid biosynthesis glycosyltransferase
MIGSGRQPPVQPDPAPVLRTRPAVASAVLPRRSRPLPPAAPPKAPCQALLVIDRLLGHEQSQAPEPLPAGWNWVLANARLPSLLECLLGEAGLPWLTTILPREQAASFAALQPVQGNSRPLFSFDSQIQLPYQALAAAQGHCPLCLVVNGHQFPLCDLRGAMASHRQRRCDVTLVDLTYPSSRPYSESVVLDQSGDVERIDRVYLSPHGDTVQTERNWPALLILSPRAMDRLAEVALPQRLNQWPSVMLRLGLRLRGVTRPGICFDLHQRDSLPQLAAHLLLHKFSWICQNRLQPHAPGVWVGSDVHIARTAHLIGPVAIGDGARIASGAMIVGPAVIGRGAQVGNDVVLRHACLLPGAVVTGQSAHSLRLPCTPVQRPIRLHNMMTGGHWSHLEERPWANTGAKRAMDIIGAVVMLMLTLPSYLIIAAAIKINSPGPVFYGHTRQGRGGRNFKCRKFRTMVPNADQIKAQIASLNEVDGPQFKMKDDPRIFGVGRVLRRFNVDEWPQFFNVLIGQMSLVGPRPSPERENRMCPAWRDARLSVRPGISGLWQVCRKREEATDFQEWIYYDMQYVKKQSFWLDLKILFWTLRVALRGA